MCHDNSHHLLKFIFGICLYSMLIFSIKCLNFVPKWSLSFFQPFLGGNFCYHRKGKSQNNNRLLHLDNCYNKLIRRNWWKNSLLIHVAFYICYEITWYTFWEQNDNEKGNLFCKRLRSETDQMTTFFFLSKIDLVVNQYCTSCTCFRI